MQRCARRVVYLQRADNSSRLLPSHLHGVNQMVSSSRIRVSEPYAVLWACLQARLTRSVAHSSSGQSSYSPWGCGHGGTQNIKTSRRVKTRSVNRAAIAGVQGRHNVAEPLPLVLKGWGRAWRKLAWGSTKL